MNQKMCKYLSILILAANLIGCKAAFDMAVYEDSLLALHGSGGNIQATALLNQSIVSAELVSARIPPGVYADYGTLLYREGKIAEAVEQITKEEELYPESKQFIQRLLAVLKRTKADQADSVSSQHRTPSILILPPINKSGRPEAGPAFELTLNRQIVERGYYVFPVLATTMLFQDGGLKPADIQGGESSFLKELTGADGLLYVTITDWQNTWLLIPLIRVTAEYRLIDATTGRELWKCAVSGEFDPTVTGGAGGPVYAMTKDLRVPARSLTKQAITSSQDGLPYGPYH